MDRKDVKNSRLYRHTISGLVETGEYFLSLRKDATSLHIEEIKKPSIEQMIELLQARGVI